MAGWNNYWRGYNRFSFFQFSFNWKVVIAVLVVISVVALSVVGYKTGSYIKTLEQNKTNLESEIANTSTALNSCIENLEIKTASSNSCQKQLSTTGDSLSSCQNELNMCQSDYDDLTYQLTDLYVQLDNCEAALSSAQGAQSNFDSMKVNYAKDYCCTKNNVQSGQTTYYKLENNKITCYTSASSGTTSITC